MGVSYFGLRKQTKILDKLKSLVHIKEVLNLIDTIADTVEVVIWIIILSLLACLLITIYPVYYLVRYPDKVTLKFYLCIRPLCLLRLIYLADEKQWLGSFIPEAKMPNIKLQAGYTWPAPDD